MVAGVAGNMPITSEIIADSLNPNGDRLTTFVLEYPRYIHSELMTHRVFSKNAASSRAIPIEKMIQQVIDNPAIPSHWGKNQSGMQANEELDDVTTLYIKEVVRPVVRAARGYRDMDLLTAKDKAKQIWLEARDKAIEYVKQLNELGLHKQIANRLLEPWFHIRIILSGTEFENFFALRAHKDAHPDLQKLAYLMLEQYNKSEPKKLNSGEWHIPFGDKIDENRLISLNNSNHDIESIDWHLGMNQLKRKIAVARCARISYLNYEGKDDYEADIKLCDRLFGSVPKHLSPCEHVAMALGDSTKIGNFTGFKQFRHFFPGENLKDTRVIKKI